MLCETDIKVSWRARPRGFVALMSLYESNYLRFLQLAGDPARLNGTLVSRVEGDCELQLHILEHMPYTSMLRMTYALPSGDAAGAPEWLPNLRLRAYHDARLLEADEFKVPATGDVGQSRRASQLRERELDQRWTRNMMLNKWLEYCAERGHRFAA
ncbi:MAG TPA: DUF1249 domain-containing protein [Steroidobacteraceae bacterium]|nr:DUF1249 domain-containing protein [Steroidobacteraceae bacterium]